MYNSIKNNNTGKLINNYRHQLGGEDYKIPVIGVLTVPVSKTFKNQTIKSYLSDSYVKWIEMSGAKVVPILYSWTKKKILNTVSQLNGVVFPGGSVDRVKGKAFMNYIDSFRTIFNYAMMENDQGNYFPLWATCLGFEFLLLMVLNNNKAIHDNYVNETLIQKVKARHQAVPLTLLPGSPSNSIFKGFNKSDLNLFNTECIYMNHGYGFIYNKSLLKWITPYIDILSVNSDSDGVDYLSTIKFKDYPFYGTQWHPEKVMFEWLDKAIPHTKNSIYVSKVMSDMFVDECRRGNNTLENHKLLIYYYSLYSRTEVLDVIDPKHNQKRNKSVFEQSYYFN
jgi:gamma-glutamyl hydrolase